jgi:bifunctional non-homologous end joining protein LigD
MAVKKTPHRRMRTPGMYSKDAKIIRARYKEDVREKMATSAVKPKKTARPEPSPERSTSLYYKDSRSDKVYTVIMKPHPTGAGFNVYAVYGRRNSTMQTDLKTPTPVLEETAGAIFEKLVREKTNKGYTTGPLASGVQFPEETDKEAVRAAGTHDNGLPSHQLLNAIDKAQAEKLIRDDDWMMQPKFDGVRCRIELTPGKIGWIAVGTSRTQKRIALPDAVMDILVKQDKDLVIDGELVGETYICFDVLKHGDRMVNLSGAEHRAGYVQGMFGKSTSGILAIMTAITTAEKERLYETAHKNGMEGLVFKRRTKPYTAGRPNSGGDALKYKFLNTCSVIVKGRHGNKNSIDVMLHGGRDMGSVTMIGKSIPPPGTIVEIEYLYVHDVGGKLIQPVFIGVREDVPPEECTAEQLVVKGEERE